MDDLLNGFLRELEPAVSLVAGSTSRDPRDARVLPTAARAVVETLPPGQRRVVEGLLTAEDPPTYREVAFKLGLSRGTVHRHLGRIRCRRPESYAVIMEERRRQLGERHEQAVLRAARHSDTWHRRQSARRFYYRFGRWPWERG